VGAKCAGRKAVIIPMTTPTIANAENIMEIFKTENMTLVILVGIFQNQSSATIARPAPLLEES